MYTELDIDLDLSDVTSQTNARGSFPNFPELSDLGSKSGTSRSSHVAAPYGHREPCHTHAWRDYLGAFMLYVIPKYCLEKIMFLLHERGRQYTGVELTISK